MEVLDKSHLILQMGNCPIPIAEHSGLSLFYQLKCKNFHTNLYKKGKPFLASDRVKASLRTTFLVQGFVLVLLELV